tara:strand:- start:7431 stop:8504 length:1074 start_codon:yes stop_codon:yes gene_type:complete
MQIKKKNIISGRNIVFLYAQLTPYFLGCINNYSDANPNNKILIIYLNSFKNLKSNSNNNCQIIHKDKFKSREEIKNFIKKLNPAVLLVSGRMDSEYLYVARYFINKTIRVTLQDTMYQKTFKQLIQSIFSKYLYRQYFDKFWGVGTSQTDFAKRIGFNQSEISEGFYVADKIFFDNKITYEYNNIKKLKFLFIGRLAKEKNIIKLAKAIESINILNKCSHQLTVIGEGKKLSQLLSFNCVDYQGFKSQKEIIEIARECHAFCLPSIYEPWGVVVHEMAALGLPILSSNKCGSSYNLVIDNFNGFKFNPYNLQSIIQSLNNFILLDNKEKKKFSINSNLIAQEINHNNWNNILNSFLI